MKHHVPNNFGVICGGGFDRRADDFSGKTKNYSAHYQKREEFYGRRDAGLNRDRRQTS